MTGIRLIDPALDRDASDEQWNLLTTEPWKKWDILNFGEEPSEHVGIYYGDGFVLHAVKERGVVFEPVEFAGPVLYSLRLKS
ncbi:unnamed protein product [marine sediment metagenome]|uniref:NlpC/P60 domain-containing protein n=1 Tax=marine sediment metagenome TaxID=412755 RepID=X0SKE5_9ZZZZ